MGETEIPIYIAKDLPTVTDSLIQSIIQSSLILTPRWGGKWKGK